MPERITMPKRPATDQHRREQTRRLIEDMLKERQQMLVLLWELSKLDFSTVDAPVLEMLEDFQELLVDYIAAGHFGLYQRISEGTERRKAVLEVAREIYPRIAATTDVAVEFTERYDRPDDALIRDKLAADLSLLGEQVSTRLELEDRLILALLGNDYQLPAGPAAR